MRDLIIFNGASNLDFQDIRTNVIRIPEVVGRLREAQDIWDTLSPVSLDLTNFVASEDSVYLGNIRLKTFVTAVVQVGLLDRFLKHHPLTEFVLGAVNGDSPLSVALGQKSFQEMVSESLALSGHSVRSGLTPLLGGELPVLSGVQLVEYGVFRSGPEKEFFRVMTDVLEVEKMVFSLIDDFEVKKVIMVGPGNSLFGKRALELADRDIQMLESIDLDPMLSWFWSRLQGNRLAIAN